MSENEKNELIENEILKGQIVGQLETVIDPELGIDIVNLGLVYQVNLFEDGTCEVQITLTTMGCPFGDIIENDIKQALMNISEIQEITVKLVWYPAWDPSRMSRYARIALGIR